MLPDICESIETSVRENPVTGDTLFATIERAGPTARARDYTLSELLEAAGEVSREVGVDASTLSQYVQNELDD